MTQDPPNDRRRDSTATLVAKVRVGDRSAENEIASRQLAELRQWARRKVPQAARAWGDTEDLVQETVLRMLGRLSEIDVSRPGGLQNYLRKSFKNRLIDALRRTGRRPKGEELHENQVADPRASAQSVLLARESATRFRAALERLSASDRRLIIAWVEREWDYKKIARVLDKPSINAARVAVYRACERLWAHFEPTVKPPRGAGAPRRRVAVKKRTTR